MKKLLFALAAMLTIVGCSNEELLDQPVKTKGSNVKVIVDDPEGGNSRVYSTTGGTATGDGQYDQGANFSVSASANSKYHISYFYGGPASQPKKCNYDCSSNPTSRSYEDKMAGEDHIYHVGFAKDTYTLTVNSETGGTASGTTTAEWGSNVTIKAIPSSGFVFDKWQVTSGDATITNPNSATTTVTINSTNSTVVAKYTFSYFVIDKLVRIEENKFGDIYYLYIKSNYPVQGEAKLYTIGETISTVWNGSYDEEVNSSQIQAGFMIEREETKSNEVVFRPDYINGYNKTIMYLRDTNLITWESGYESEQYKIGKDEWKGIIDVYAPR